MIKRTQCVLSISMDKQIILIGKKLKSSQVTYFINGEIYKYHLPKVDKSTPGVYNDKNKNNKTVEEK